MGRHLTNIGIFCKVVSWRIRRFIAAFCFIFVWADHSSASVIGSDDRAILSSDIALPIVRLADKIGSITRWDENREAFSAGTGQLVKWRDREYIVTARHSFFDQNENAYSNTRTSIYFSTQYYPIDEDFGLIETNFHFRLLNDIASNHWVRNPVKDFLILAVDHTLADEIIYGQPRGAIELADMTFSELENAFKTRPSYLISEAQNFHDNTEVGLSKDCRGHPKQPQMYFTLWIHYCDTGKGSSGAGIFLSVDGKFLLGGIHVRGTEGNCGFHPKQSSEGNCFIPAPMIIREFERLEDLGIIK